MSLRIERRAARRTAQVLFLVSVPFVIIGCSSVPVTTADTGETTSARPKPGSAATSSSIPALPRAGSGRGGYYLDDGPGDNPPEGLLETADPEPRIEPYSTRGNKSYVVFGKRYTPFTDERPYKEIGIGSWYGKKFHGQKTSSGELYDMYKMTAAHPTLPIPSYARVTNLANGRQVIVRVNDRGPFHSGRIIDLSYTAALKLGYLDKGSGRLEVERLLPDDIRRMADARQEQTEQKQQSMPTSEVFAAAATLQATPQTEAVAEVSTASYTIAVIPPADASLVPAGITTPVSPLIEAPPGFYLQLGTFSQEGNAEAERKRFAHSAAFALPRVEVMKHGLLYRVYGGPFASKAEAASAALRIQEESTSRPLIVQR